VGSDSEFDRPLQLLLETLRGALSAEFFPGDLLLRSSLIFLLDTSCFVLTKSVIFVSLVDLLNTDFKVLLGGASEESSESEILRFTPLDLARSKRLLGVT